MYLLEKRQVVFNYVLAYPPFLIFNTGNFRHINLTKKTSFEANEAGFRRDFLVYYVIVRTTFSRETLLEPFNRNIIFIFRKQNKQC